MPRLLSLLILVGVVLASCRPPAYVQPTELEPHAILKIRHIVHARGGPLYSSAIRIGRFSVDERTLDDPQSESSTIHLRIRPGTDTFGVEGTSFHMERRMVTRYRTQYETYSCPRQSCSGYGSSQRCYSTYSTCTRSRQVPYTDWVTVPVTDDRCYRVVAFAPRVGGTYMVQFDYLGENQCELACFEQIPTPDGAFSLAPCPLPPAPAASR